MQSITVAKPSVNHRLLALVAAAIMVAAFVVLGAVHALSGSDQSGTRTNTINPASATSGCRPASPGFQAC
jgi:hypothetical protein